MYPCGVKKKHESLPLSQFVESGGLDFPKRRG
jgi:hypothetical protein